MRSLNAALFRSPTQEPPPPAAATAPWTSTEVRVLGVPSFPGTEGYLRRRGRGLFSRFPNSCSTCSPAAARPPEGRRGGAGRPGSRPRAMTNIRCWAQRTPCSAASDPLPGAWNAIHQPGWSRRSTSPHPYPKHRRSDGLSANRARHWTAAPGSCAETRPCREPAPHFRGMPTIAELPPAVMCCLHTL